MYTQCKFDLNKLQIYCCDYKICLYLSEMKAKHSKLKHGKFMSWFSAVFFTSLTLSTTFGCDWMRFNVKRRRLPSKTNTMDFWFDWKINLLVCFLPHKIFNKWSIKSVWNLYSHCMSIGWHFFFNWRVKSINMWLRSSWLYVNITFSNRTTKNWNPMENQSTADILYQVQNRYRILDIGYIILPIFPYYFLCIISILAFIPHSRTNKIAVHHLH